MSQPSEITLTVDTENDGVDPEEQVYALYDGSLQNRSIYIGAAHSLTSRDTLTLYRTAPKPNGNFLGVAKTAAKFSEDITVDGADGVSTLTAPMIREVSYSFPVGTSLAQQLAFRQRGIALEDLDSVMVPLNNQLMI